MDNQILTELQKGGIVRLCSKKIDDNAFTYLCSQPTQQVQELHLHINQITSLGLKAFQSANWRSLRCLNLYSNKIGDLGCKYLSNTTLHNIQEVRLPNNVISSLGIFHLSKSSWKNLQNLNLSINKLTLESLRWLSKAKWPKLNRNFLTSLQVLQLLLFASEQLKEVALQSNEIDLGDLQEKKLFKNALNNKMANTKICF